MQHSMNFGQFGKDGAAMGEGGGVGWSWWVVVVGVFF
jgi:hypothetical protein